MDFRDISTVVTCFIIITLLNFSKTATTPATSAGSD